MASERVHAALRANLVDLMAQRGLSQRALSRLATLDETAVKQILSGRSRSPRLDTVVRLAEALGTSVSHLIGDRQSDVERYSVLAGSIDVFRRLGLMTLDEAEARAVAAAMAEALAQHAADGPHGADHVASVARNVVSLRRYRRQDGRDGKKAGEAVRETDGALAEAPGEPQRRGVAASDGR